MTTEHKSEINQLKADIRKLKDENYELRTSKDDFKSRLSHELEQGIALIQENTKLQTDNEKLEFELNEYKAIVSELRIYEICWNKLNPVADVTLSRGRGQLDELLKPKVVE